MMGKYKFPKELKEAEKIKEMKVPVMSQAINAYYTITASSEFREKARGIVNEEIIFA